MEEDEAADRVREGLDTKSACGFLQLSYISDFSIGKVNYSDDYQGKTQTRDHETSIDPSPQNKFRVLFQNYTVVIFVSVHIHYSGQTTIICPIFFRFDINLPFRNILDNQSLLVLNPILGGLHTMFGEAKMGTIEGNTYFLFLFYGKNVC